MHSTRFRIRSIVHLVTLLGAVLGSLAADGHASAAIVHRVVNLAIPANQ